MWRFRNEYNNNNNDNNDNNNNNNNINIIIIIISINGIDYNYCLLSLNKKVFCMWYLIHGKRISNW